MQTGEPGSSLVSIRVLSVTPARAGKLSALTTVEVDIDGVQIAIHGIRALRVGTAGTRIDLPQFRGPIGDAVLDELIERGLAVRRFRLPTTA